MENRGVYRGVEERVLSGETLSVVHPHSPISISLRRRYREVRDAREHRYYSFLGLMAMYSHPKASFDKGNEAMRDALDFAISAIPYYNVGRKDDPDGRDRAARLYAAIRKNVTDRMIAEEQAKIGK